LEESRVNWRLTNGRRGILPLSIEPLSPNGDKRFHFEEVAFPPHDRCALALEMHSIEL
jgi:hypothetical protein